MLKIKSADDSRWSAASGSSLSLLSQRNSRSPGGLLTTKRSDFINTKELSQKLHGSKNGSQAALSSNLQSESKSLKFGRSGVISTSPTPPRVGRKMKGNIDWVKLMEEGEKEDGEVVAEAELSEPDNEFLKPSRTNSLKLSVNREEDAKAKVKFERKKDRRDSTNHKIHHTIAMPANAKIVDYLDISSSEDASTEPKDFKKKMKSRGPTSMSIKEDQTTPEMISGPESEIESSSYSRPKFNLNVFSVNQLYTDTSQGIDDVSDDPEGPSLDEERDVYERSSQSQLYSASATPPPSTTPSRGIADIEQPVYSNDSISTVICTESQATVQEAGSSSQTDTLTQNTESREMDSSINSIKQLSGSEKATYSMHSQSSLEASKEYEDTTDTTHSRMDGGSKTSVESGSTDDELSESGDDYTLDFYEDTAGKSKLDTDYQESTGEESHGEVASPPPPTTTTTAKQRSKVLRPSRLQHNTADAGVQVQTLLDDTLKILNFHSGVKPTFPEYADPSPVILSAGALQELMSHTPNMTVLNESLKSQLQLTEELVRCSRDLVLGLTSSLQADYQYTTLQDTRSYIQSHKPKVLTFSEARKKHRHKQKRS